MLQPLSLSVPLSLPLPLSLSLSKGQSLYLSLPLSLPVCLTHSLPASLSLPVCLSLCLSLSQPASISLLLTYSARSDLRRLEEDRIIYTVLWYKDYAPRITCEPQDQRRFPRHLLLVFTTTLVNPYYSS